MKQPPSESRPAVRIEVENEWAWCGERRLRLTPKAFAVLRHLVEHAERLITKEEFFTVIWREAIVSEATLTSCIRDLRKALGDSSRTPRYIQTAHRRGFRFIGPIARPAVTLAPAPPGRESSRPSTPPAISLVPPVLVGRDTELEWLRVRLTRAANGQRQLVFVTGEPGIGKTALVEMFLSEVAGRDGRRTGRGQCVEQYGAGEAYLPGARGALTTEPRGPERLAGRDSPAARADMARAVAGAVDRPRPGRRATARGGSDARSNVARVRGSARCDLR